MNTLPPFKENKDLTLGVELELQLIDLQHFNLAMEAKDFLRRVGERNHTGKMIPEITQSMIELNSSVHESYSTLVQELRELRDILAEEALQTHIGICGGGTHPFQQWKEQRIYPTERFASVSEQYGYLAKQFTIFGQHIHIACPNGDDAMYLCHAFARYIPQFIALSAASPFQQGVDTAFDCSRLAIISAFPMSGTPPWILTWKGFEEYFSRMAELSVVKSMKDFYWDIRPKPEYGTVEVRICDTPLTVEKAAELGAYAQLLVYWLLDQRPQLSKDIYITYLINRYRATRYGLDAICIDPITRTQATLTDNIINTVEHLEPYAKRFHAEVALKQIKNAALNHANGAAWLRKKYSDYRSLNDVVRSQVKLWRKG
ncbi:MAG: glutamate--cysteine ligase [Gammaproteobacteria bacterium]|nr:glutamate--cysteine ligase [Gammaproteobacteria bacterium]